MASPRGRRAAICCGCENYQRIPHVAATNALLSRAQTGAKEASRPAKEGQGRGSPEATWSRVPRLRGALD